MDIEEMYNVLDSFVLGFTMKGQSKTAEKADSKKERTLSDGTEENSRTNTLAFDIFLFPIQRLAEHLTLLIHLHRELFYCARKAKTDTASEERAKVSGRKLDFILRTGLLLMIGISFFSELLEHDPFLPSLVEYEIFFFFFSIL